MAEDKKVIKIDEVKESETKAVKPKTTATKTTKKTTKPKKLTQTVIKKKIAEIANVQKVLVTVKGDVFQYEIDTEVLGTKATFLDEAITADLGFLMGVGEDGEEYAEFFNSLIGEEMIGKTMELLITADIMRIFSDFDIENTVEAKITFIQQMSNIGILGDILDNIPEAIQNKLSEIEEEKSKMFEQLTEQAEKLKEDYKILENQMKTVDEAIKENK